MKTLICIGVASGATMFAALITHVIICIKGAQYGLLIAGAVAPPVGIVHGVGHWFGAW